MKVTLRCEKTRIGLVCDLLNEQGLFVDQDVLQVQNVLQYPSDELYREIDRFLDHCQAIGLIRDWQIER